MRPDDPVHKRPYSLKAWLMVLCIMGILVLTVGANVTYAITHPTFWTEHIPVMNATHHEIAMTEYRGAVNVSYADLCAFLANDTTEMADYRYPNYTCGDFALRLHDRAETHGIRSGIVAITLNTTGYLDDISNDPPNDTGNAGNDRGHAFNVFNTTDRGLVYVDATGVTAAEKRVEPPPVKMFVYFQKGMPLGEIALNQSERFDYAYYQRQEEVYALYIQNVNRLLDDIKEYDLEAKALNGTLNSTLDAKRQELRGERQDLARQDEANWIITKPFGIVDGVSVYW